MYKEVGVYIPLNLGQEKPQDFVEYVPTQRELDLAQRMSDLMSRFPVDPGFHVEITPASMLPEDENGNINPGIAFLDGVQLVASLSTRQVSAKEDLEKKVTDIIHSRVYYRDNPGAKGEAGMSDFDIVEFAVSEYRAYKERWEKKRQNN